MPGMRTDPSTEYGFYEKFLANSSTPNPTYFMTNFFNSPMMIEGARWETTEQYFQAMKFDNATIQSEIQNCGAAGTAFRLARQYGQQRRKDWEKPTSPDGVIVKEAVMVRGL